MGRAPQFSVLWLVALLVLVPFMTASFCGRYTFSFPMHYTPPIWSADQSKIVFNSSFGTLFGQAHVVDSDGSELFSFPHKSGEYATGVSPDGVVVFTALDTSDTGLFGLSTPYYEIHTARLDGSARRRLAGGRDYHYAVWSPDGETIAFSSSDGGLYVMNKNGSKKKRIAHRDMMREQFPDVGIVYNSPVVWSPDGDKLAFLASERTDESQDAIYTVNIDGRVFNRLSPSASFPAWSPDGTSIAFVKNDSGSRSRSSDDVSTIYTINSDGSNLREVGSFPEELQFGVREGKVSWSRDGSQIRLHQTPFVTVNIDGSNLRIMANCGLLAEWSPDESMIAVVRNSLLVMASDGSDIRLLAKSSQDNVWSAAGSTPSTNPYIMERCKWKEVTQ